MFSSDIQDVNQRKADLKRSLRLTSAHPYEGALKLRRHGLFCYYRYC